MSLEVLCSRCGKDRPGWPDKPCPCGSGKHACATHGDWDGPFGLGCPACRAIGHATRTLAAGTATPGYFKVATVASFPEINAGLGGATWCVCGAQLNAHARGVCPPKLLPTVLGAPDAPKSREELERGALDAERDEITAWMTYLAAVGKRRMAHERLISHLRAPGSR